MKTVYILMLAVYITLFTGCGSSKLFNTMDIKESSIYYERMQPDDESDIVYLIGNSDYHWNVDCLVNNNPIGKFKFNNYQILRLYKDVGVHTLKCKVWYIDPTKVYYMPEQFTIKPKGNKKHYIEYDTGPFGTKSAELATHRDLNPNKHRLTQECFDCYEVAPKRFYPKR